ncbi:MAG: S8 family serine peptidase [Proteobacteria bacterium]|nr:S8 family serine peptidase [Pseudomonadota bacterium]
MQVPVLVVLPSQAPLKEAAAAFLAGADHRDALSSASVPSAVALDSSFPAVPVGSSGPGGTHAATLAPEASERFAVRGTVDVDHVSNVPTHAEGHPIFSDPAISPFLTCGGTPPVGGAGEVQQRLKTAALAARGLDGAKVAVAIMDTGINLAHLQAQPLSKDAFLDIANSWVVPGTTTTPGFHPLDHGTMCAYDVLIAAPKATLLDYPVLGSKAPGGALGGSVLSLAFKAYSQIMSSWAVSFDPNGLSRYDALVISNAWGILHPTSDFPEGHPGRYIDNPNHPFNQLVGMLVRSGADIVFAAGNCGSPCADISCSGLTTGMITGANALADVLTLAGCDTADERVGYSSQGPSIANMFQNKPDVTAYTHFQGSLVAGANAPDGGTSAACAVAAGCVAALRTRLKPSATPSAGLFDQLRATARRPPGVAAAGWNADYGFGIIDPEAVAQHFGV